MEKSAAFKYTSAFENVPSAGSFEEYALLTSTKAPVPMTLANQLGAKSLTLTFIFLHLKKEGECF
ncbi:hypothetical protein [Thermococcus sp. 2319x1]|uniref:hypothetical protein n=1 Tax=Thermococcus sp. 2319x1 TaxID=1674923 RepID=UPI00351A53EE